MKGTFSRLTALAAVSVLFAGLTGSAGAATIVWDFDVSGDDGQTDDGWTHVMGFSAPSAPASGGRSAAGSLGGAASQDGAHPTLLMRSPTFKLDGSGPLSFDLSGGQGNGSSQATLPASDATVLAVPNSTDPGVQGVALRRNSTGAYVLTAQRPVSTNTFATQSWTVGDLAPYANDGSVYTFDYYEYKHGGWGHMEIDDVSVPGTLYPFPVVVADENYDGGSATGWNDNTVETSNPGGNFTAGFLGRHAGQSNQQLYKTFSLPPGVRSVDVEFDFYEIDSWDTERFVVYIDDVIVFDEFFAHGTNDSYPGVSSTAPANLGFSGWSEQFHSFSINVPTTASSIKLGFGAFLNSAIADESMGIDNVKITAYIPEPSTFALAAIGLLGLLGWRRRSTKD